MHSGEKNVSFQPEKANKQKKQVQNTFISNNPSFDITDWDVARSATWIRKFPLKTNPSDNPPQKLECKKHLKKISEKGLKQSNVFNLQTTSETK